MCGELHYLIEPEREINNLQVVDIYQFYPSVLANAMDSSQILGVTEDNGSSDSGWTMYIGSPVHENDNYDFDDDGDHSTDKQEHDYDKDKYGDDDDKNDDDDVDDSDDSMASDASSGPRHHELPCGSGERSLGMDGFKHTASQCTSKEKLHRQLKKRGERRMKEKQESVAKANSAASHVQSGAKVRKTN